MPDVVGQSKRRRDDFKARDKLLLAQRVGHLCSNPKCQRPTIGPRKGEEGVNNLGIAAHIRAAAEGGPRYDKTQSAEERQHPNNGIWLCSDHAHLIDHDENEYTVEVLESWKRDAEERAFQQLASGRGPASVDFAAGQLLEELHALRVQLSLPEDIDPEELVATVRSATLQQVEAFEGTPRWPRHAVNLGLSVTNQDVGSLALYRFPAVLAASQHIVVLSGPGTGKTTTLVQLARIMLADGPAPIIIPLSEWAESADDLLTWATRRRGFGGVSANHLKLLAEQGLLTLLLDGWNEVPHDARRRLIVELRGLERDYPLLGLVVSTRRESRDVPLTARQLGLNGLGDEQQLDIARAMRGSEGISLVDAAMRTPGLRDLIAIPLYLRALLVGIPSGSGNLPETKEQVLRLLVEAHGADPANAELLHRDLMGEQARYLAEIATAAQRAGTTSLPEADAKSAVAHVNAGLAAQGLAPAPPHAQRVLDLLVAGHGLVRDASGTYSFQHQQIQEWFASGPLEAEMRHSVNGLTLAHALTTGPLNDPAWGETVLFACERLSRSDTEGAAKVADIVRVLLQMDPIFAASIIKRSSQQVWDNVGEDVMRFARRWHQPDHPDAAAAFMIATGRPEFTDTIWPLVAGPNEQLQMRTFRLVPRFNPSVLGDRLLGDYMALPEKTRETLVVELAFHGDRAGIDAAHDLALSEPSISIRGRVFDGLAFRAATAQLEDLLHKSGEALAEEVARHGHLDDVRDPELVADLQRRRAEQIATDPSPERRLARGLYELTDDDLPALIEETLSDPSYSFKENGERAAVEAATRFPREVAEALLVRILGQLSMPYRPFRYLDAISPTDDPAILKLLLGQDVQDSQTVDAAAYAAGPFIVGQLVERYLEAESKFRADDVRTEVAYAPVRALTEVLKNVRPSVLFQVLQMYAEGASVEQIEALSSVITRAGPPRENDEPLRLTETERADAVALLNSWANQMLLLGASRHTLGHLTWAMRRLPDNSQVPALEAMLDFDLATVREARAAFDADRRNKAALQEIQHSYTLDFRMCLTGIGTSEAEKVLRDRLSDREFGIEAAIGLQVIWMERNEPRSERMFPIWPDFGRALANRDRDRTVSSDSADAILEAYAAARAEGTPRAIFRALRFAGAAALLPHGDQSAQFGELLALDADRRARLEFAQRMVVGGLVVPSETILALLRRFFDELGKRKWASDNEANEIIDWLELLPFSDRPASVLDGLDAVIARRELGMWRLRDILRSVGFIAEPERSALLRDIIKRMPELTGEYELYQAIGSPTGPALELVLDIAAGRVGSKAMGQAVRHDYAASVWHALSTAEREGLSDRFRAATVTAEKAFIAEILLAGGNHETFLELVTDPTGQLVIQRMGWMVRQQLLYIQEPAGVDTSSYELIPRDISRLRAGLFDLSLAPDRGTAVFALRYLQDIEMTRVEEGGSFTGPRHPHIETGQPWPALVAQSDS